MDKDLKQLSEELNLKIRLLQQRIAVVDEILLHKSRKIDEETAHYYVQVMNKFGNFFNAITNSLQSSFYVELLAFLGAKLNKNAEIINDKYSNSSVYVLAQSCNRLDGYLAILGKHKETFGLIDNARHRIAHSTSIEELNNTLVPGYNQVVNLLNDVAGFVMSVHDEVHGIPSWNTPHTLDEENDYAGDTERLINAITSSSKSVVMREKYMAGKQRMRDLNE